MCGRPLRSPDTEGHLFQFKLLSASPLIRWDIPHTAHAHSNQFIYRLQTEMTSWFNLIVSNRIIHGNKLPKWGYSLPKSFNNDGNHGHDVSQYYFITGFSLCICQLGLASARAQLVSRLMHSCWQLTQTHTPCHPTLQGHKGEWRHPVPPAATDSGLLPHTIQFHPLPWSKEADMRTLKDIPSWEKMWCYEPSCLFLHLPHTHLMMF